MPESGALPRFARKTALRRKTAVLHTADGSATAVGCAEKCVDSLHHVLVTTSGGMKINDKEFERIVGRSLDRIPDEIMRHVKNVAIRVEDRPEPELLEEMGMPEDEILFGLYTGEALPDRLVTFPSFYPDTIILFKEPLLDFCRDIEELEEEIEITVVHEIAHYFGISEERLAELGYD